VVRDDIFPVLWQFLSSRRAPPCGASRTNSGRRIFAAFGGKKCSNYFQDSAPARKCQVRLARFGGLGDQIVGNFGRKKSVGGFELVKENFFK